MKRNLPIKPKRVVVKVGTRILTSKKLRLNKNWIKTFVRQLAALINKDIEVVVVTSGAIGAGMGTLGLDSRPKLLPRQQAAAAIGQSQLMKIYDTFFKHHNLVTAQILLTRDDLSNRQRYLNAKNTLLTLLDYHVVPIINENDTVSVDEIKFGDNDKLSALVASLIQADLLIILSDIDGLYGPNKDVISIVKRVDSEIEKVATKSTSGVGTGGMASKVEAARICSASGIVCIVANGKVFDILSKIIKEQDIGTLFVPRSQQLVAKKRWIGFSTKVNGEILVDEGAKQALIAKKKSLLAGGVVKICGTFAVGDTVSISDTKNHEFGRGMVNYSSDELAKIKGQKSNQIASILGYKYYDEVIHRDNLVIL